MKKRTVGKPSVFIYVPQRGKVFKKIRLCRTSTNGEPVVYQVGAAFDASNFPKSGLVYRHKYRLPYMHCGFRINIELRTPQIVLIIRYFKRFVNGMKGGFLVV